MSRNIRGWRQKQSQAPPIPTRRSGYEIPEDYQNLKNGDPFLLYDSSAADEKRILIFVIRAGIQDLRKNKMWACDGTFKCSSDLYYQLFTIYIVFRSVSVPRLFILLPNKTETTYNKLLQYLKGDRTNTM